MITDTRQKPLTLAKLFEIDTPESIHAYIFYAVEQGRKLKKSRKDVLLCANIRRKTAQKNMEFFFQEILVKAGISDSDVKKSLSKIQSRMGINNTFRADLLREQYEQLDRDFPCVVFSLEDRQNLLKLVELSTYCETTYAAATEEFPPLSLPPLKRENKKTQARKLKLQKSRAAKLNHAASKSVEANGCNPDATTHDIGAVFEEVSHNFGFSCSESSSAAEGTSFLADMPLDCDPTHFSRAHDSLGVNADFHVAEHEASAHIPLWKTSSELIHNFSLTPQSPMPISTMNQMDMMNISLQHADDDYFKLSQQSWTSAKPIFPAVFWEPDAAAIQYFNPFEFSLAESHNTLMSNLPASNILPTYSTSAEAILEPSIRLEKDTDKNQPYLTKIDAPLEELDNLFFIRPTALSSSSAQATLGKKGVHNFDTLFSEITNTNSSSLVGNNKKNQYKKL